MKRSALSSSTCWCTRSAITSACRTPTCTRSNARRVSNKISNQPARAVRKGRDTMKIDGACHCGAITIEGEADPEKVGICHCTDCQTGTGSAFRVSIPVPGSTFKMKGQPATYLKNTADSGVPRAQAFCGKCGSPIY